jgi:hypothetical protein
MRLLTVAFAARLKKNFGGSRLFVLGFLGWVLSFLGGVPETVFSMRSEDSLEGFCIQIDSEDFRDSFHDEFGSSTDEPVQMLVIRCSYHDISFAIAEMGRFVRECESS